MLRLPNWIVPVLIALPIAVVGVRPAEAQTWQPGQKLECGVGQSRGRCLRSGPGCDLATVPGQCVFPKATAIDLCRKHPECVALTCYGSTCFARQNSHFMPDPAATSIAVPKPPPAAPAPTTSPPTSASSQALRDYLATEAASIRKGLPDTLINGIEAVGITTSCAVGCDKVGSRAIVIAARVNDFDLNTMPVSLYRSRLAALSKQVCADPQVEARFFVWGIDILVDLADRNGARLEQLQVTARDCGVSTARTPAKDQFFSISGAQGCLEVASKSKMDGALIVSAPCDGSTSQRFQFRSAGQNAAGEEIWMIANANSTLCLTVDGSSNQPGAAIKQSICRSHDRQWFRWIDDSAPFNQIATSGSLNLDATFGSTAITQQSSTGAIEQSFRAIPSPVQTTGPTPQTPTQPPVPPTGIAGPSPQPPAPVPPRPRPAPPVVTSPPQPQPPTPVPPTVNPPAPAVTSPQPPSSAAADAAKKAAEEKARQEALARARDYARGAANDTSQERAASVATDLEHIKIDLPSEDLTYVRRYSGRLEDGKDTRVGAGLFSTGYLYVVQAVCDQGCVDLDLVLRDNDGREVAADTQGDNSPFVEVKPPFNQNYTLEVVMPDCQADPCEWGVVVARQALQTAAAKALKLAQVNQAAEEERTERLADGLRSMAVRTGELIEGAEKNMTLPQFLGGTTYTLLGFCDDDCGDLGLELIDSSGRRVESKHGSYEPEFEITPSSTRTYSLNVRMNQCGDDPCKFRILVLRNP